MQCSTLPMRNEGAKSYSSWITSLFQSTWISRHCWWICLCNWQSDCLWRLFMDHSESDWFTAVAFFSEHSQGSFNLEAILTEKYWIFCFFSSTIFDPYVRLAGASGPAYAMLSAHLANVILHHASMSRPFLRLTGLLAVASLEVGFGIYRRYVSTIYLHTCMYLLWALTILFFFLHIYPFSK